MLDRALQANERIDTKSVLVVPALAAVATLALATVKAPPGLFDLACATVAGCLSLVAAFYSLASAYAGVHGLGAAPVEVAARTGDKDTSAYKQAIVDELAVAVEQTIALVNVRAVWFNRSLFAAAGALIAFAAFVGAGGWA